MKAFENIEQAVKNCSENEKIVFGTKTEKYHIIDCSDRDYDTNFSLSREDVYLLGAGKAITHLKYS
jgi:hypothetical protein